MQKIENPLLLRARLPGQTFALPSKGIFYTNGELSDDVVNGEIVINPMVTYDEIIFKTPDKLLNGTALSDVFSRCIPQILKPFELLSKDVDYIMVALRKITYGEQLEIQHTHTCENAEEHIYLINLSMILKGAKQLIQKKVDKDFQVTLENGQVIKLRPARYSTVLKFFEALRKNEQNPNSVSESQSLIDSINDSIESVDGYTDHNLIDEWLKNIPAGYVREIITKTNVINEWGINTNTKIKCKDCGENIELELPLNPINFF